MANMDWASLTDDEIIEILKKAIELPPRGFLTEERLRITAMPDGDATVKSPEEHVTERVDQIIKDFDGGKIGRGDAIRVRDRATRAVKDMEGYKGFGKRYGEPGYGEE